MCGSVHTNCTKSADASKGSTKKIGAKPSKRSARASNANPNSLPGKRAPELANILLIDDDAPQVATRQMILANAGHQVLVATNSRSALGLLKAGTGNAEVQLVITDHFMPGVSGAELVKILWEIKPKVPIIVLSGAPEAGDQYKNLFVTFREKPISPPDLIELVKTELAKVA